MPQNPPADMPRVTPYLYYADCAAALDWLANAFGFVVRESERLVGGEGKVVHAAMEVSDSLIMMGMPGPDFEPAAKHGHRNGQIYVYVDDVDAHCEHARANGATITTELEETFYGDRRYTAEDPEGNHWTFATRIKDVAPEDWKMPSGTHD